MPNTPDPARVADIKAEADNAYVMGGGFSRIHWLAERLALAEQEREEARAFAETCQARARKAEQERDEAKRELHAALNLASQWKNAAGWEGPYKTGEHGFLWDMLDAMRSQHCDERSYADLAASGGIAPPPDDLRERVERKCGNCSFFAGPETLKCRRYPPVVIRGYQFAQLPDTGEDDWCGEFVAADVAKREEG